MKKVLVTGGTGFIGSHLTELLLKQGHPVACLVRDLKNLRWLTGLDVEPIVGDCTLPETLDRAVEGASIVIHAAGLTKAKWSRRYYAVNHIGTRNILEACARRQPPIEKFILVSSLAAAGPSLDGNPVRDNDPPRPVSDYGQSKLLAEQETLAYKDRFPVTILRPTAVYGPRDRDMFEVFLWAKRGFLAEIMGGQRFLQFCYVGDVVDALSLAVQKQTQSGSIYCTAEEQPYSWSEFRQALLSTGGVKARTVKVPYSVAWLIGLSSEAGSLFASRPAITNRQKVLEASQAYWLCDVNKTETELGFKATYPLPRGLDITWRWYRENKWL